MPLLAKNAGDGAPMGQSNPMLRAEAILHQEVTLQLRALRPNCVVVPVPNGAWFPARSPEEQSLVNRLVARLKDEGQLLPGAADLLCLWETGAGAIELKRPARRDLFGKSPAGRPSDAQKEFASLCAAHGVRHVYATSWDQVRGALTDWGRTA
jgi:hypothetical protein